MVENTYMGSLGNGMGNNRDNWSDVGYVFPRQKRVCVVIATKLPQHK